MFWFFFFEPERMMVGRRGTCMVWVLVDCRFVVVTVGRRGGERRRRRRGEGEEEEGRGDGKEGEAVKNAISITSQH